VQGKEVSVGSPSLADPDGMRPSSVAAVCAYAATALLLGVAWSPACQAASLSDFGRVRSRAGRAYFLVCAAAAFACNVTFVATAAEREGISEGEVVSSVSLLSGYNLLMLLFLPLTRRAIRSENTGHVLVLLLTAAVLQLATAVIAMGTRDGTLVGTSLAAGAHCFVNDFVLFTLHV
jgi:hypothetical protein